MNLCRWPLLPIASLAGLLALAGCSDCDKSNSASGNLGQPVPQDPLADAPEEWLAFLQWAEENLQTQPEAVPVPDSPTTAQPRWPLIRLDDAATLHTARKTCNWTIPALGSGAVPEVGPLRSDQPTPIFTVTSVRRATANGKDALRLTISGFDVRREDVGSIELTIRVPFGKHVALKWSKAGTVLVPVESVERPFAVRVLTDGFAEWQGPLRAISIITDGLGEGVVEVRSLRFMPRAQSYPEPIGIKRVRLGHEIRTAIYAHCPAEIIYENLTLPRDARLRVGLGHVAEAHSEGAVDEIDQPRARTRFEVVVGHQGTTRTVLDCEVKATEAWTDASAALARWSGKSVTLTLKCTSTSAETVAVWGNPVVYEPLDDPPLLVLYLIDTVASEHVNLYDYERETMPRLAALAARGVWFSQMFSNSSRTIESIPDLMLSMPVERHGVHHSSKPAPSGLVTLAEVLRAAGFATVSFCTNVNAGPRQRMDQGFDMFVDKIGYYWTHRDRTIPLEEVMAWIDQHRARPMFLYIHTAEPHAPYTPPGGFEGRFDPEYRGQIDGTYNRATTFRNIRDPATQRRDLEHVVALYDEEILYSDARLGLFFDALEEEGLLEKADFLVTSDHGEEFLQHGHWEHGMDLHSEQTRVPLVAFGPTFGAHGKVNVPAQFFDVMPTVLEMFDLPPPYPLHGKSLLPLLRRTGNPGEAAASGQGAEELLETLWSRNIYASNHNYRISHKLIEYSVLERGRWKLLYGWREFPMYPGGPPSHFLLFDLKTDRFERQNVIHSHQEVARRLIEDLVRWRVAQRPYDAGVRAPTEIDAQHMRDLEALGYIGDRDEEDDEPNDPGRSRSTERP